MRKHARGEARTSQAQPDLQPDLQLQQPPQPTTSLEQPPPRPMAHIAHHHVSRSSSTVLDPTTLAAGSAIGLVALAGLLFVRARRRPDSEELPIMSKQREDEERGEGGHVPPATMALAATAADAVMQPPQPLPPPSMLDQLSMPPRMPRYRRRELRRFEANEEPRHCWEAPPSHTIAVRSASYLKDGKKAPSAEGSVLLATELFRSREPVYNVASHEDAPTHDLASRTSSALESIFVVNLIIPAIDGSYQLVLYFGVLQELGPPSKAAQLLQRFADASDAFRNGRLKLLPRVREGPAAVQDAVGVRSAIVGKTLRQRFHRGDGYMEVGIDCNSSPAAGRVVSLVKSHAPSLVIDLAFLVEARASDELPERVLGCARLMYLSLDGSIPEWSEAVDQEEAVLHP